MPRALDFVSGLNSALVVEIDRQGSVLGMEQGSCLETVVWDGNSLYAI